MNYTSDTPLVQISQYLEPDPIVSLDNIIQVARKHFVANVLLGNIDVAKQDNFIQSKKVYQSFFNTLK